MSIGKFNFVSLIQFNKDSNMNINQETYNTFILPKRSTKQSAGYDFYIPYDLVIKSKETHLIYTCIKACIQSDYVLSIYPRSSLGFKYKLQLDNTVGIIDADYQYAENEGHIMIKLTNYSNDDLILNKGDRFVQGVFTKVYYVEEEDIINTRVGGLGSTDK